MQVVLYAVETACTSLQLPLQPTHYAAQAQALKLPMSSLLPLLVMKAVQAAGCGRRLATVPGPRQKLSSKSHLSSGTTLGKSTSSQVSSQCLTCHSYPTQQGCARSGPSGTLPQLQNAFTSERTHRPLVTLLKRSSPKDFHAKSLDATCARAAKPKMKLAACTDGFVACRLPSAHELFCALKASLQWLIYAALDVRRTHGSTKGRSTTSQKNSQGRAVPWITIP